MKKLGDLTVNDGKGLFDNEGLCDSMLNDLNNMLKAFSAGQHVQACIIVSGMAQKLVNLKKGIKDDSEAQVKKIEELKAENSRIVEQLTGLPVDKDGAENG